MTTTTAPETAPVAAVRIAGGSIRDDVRAAFVVWKRELIRFSRSRLRILTSLAQPILFLFVLGTGLSPLVQQTNGPEFDFRTFMFPGVLAMTVLFTSIFSAVSIVWDREFGFLREMLVAPVRRAALVSGKCLGGATVATLQGVLMLAFAGFVGVPYDPLLMLELFGLMLLTAFVITAFGIVIASRIQQVESFQVVMQFIVLPMFFLSGAVFPLTELPGWLNVLTKLDPLTYLVSPMRAAVFNYVTVPASVEATLAPPITWGSFSVGVGLEILLALIAGFALLGVAVAQFSRAD